MKNVHSSSIYFDKANNCTSYIKLIAADNGSHNDAIIFPLIFYLKLKNCLFIE